MNDSLGDRIKSQYENRYRFYLPRRTYTIIRIDAKSFHNYTKNCEKPFDKRLIEDMDITAQYLCKEIQGAQFAYVQSDEISILLTDFTTPTTDAWFDGNIQKMASVSASIATMCFNNCRLQRFSSEYCGGNDIPMSRSALFDARVFTIPDRTEVANYFIWRNNDAARNSISMVAQSLYSHKELHGKNCNEMQEMIFQKGINWSEYDMNLKNGRLIIKESYLPHSFHPKSQAPLRTYWGVKSAWIFAQNQEELYKLIPQYN